MVQALDVHASYSLRDGSYTKPCVVRNTFIHTLPDEDDEFFEALKCLEFNRSASEPDPGMGQATNVHMGQDNKRQPINSLEIIVADAVGQLGVSAKQACRSVHHASSDTSVGSSRHASSDEDSSSQRSVSGAESDSDIGKHMCTHGSDLDPSWGQDLTTVMVRHVSRQCTQWKLVSEINKCGFEGLFDFVHLPFDSKRHVNVGYGFVNFVDPRSARAFRDKFDGAYMDGIVEHKGRPIRVHPAAVQGYEANLRRFMQMESRSQDPKFSPLFLAQSPTDSSQHQVQTTWATTYCATAQAPQRQAPLLVSKHACSKCGTPRYPSQNFCSQCGTRLAQQGGSEWSYGHGHD